MGGILPTATLKLNNFFSVCANAITLSHFFFRKFLWKQFNAIGYLVFYKYFQFKQKGHFAIQY